MSSQLTGTVLPVVNEGETPLIDDNWVNPHGGHEVSLSEWNLARRIRDERSRRGLSQERLAAAMTALGFPMHQSSIAKLEKVGEGHRPISVAEALGFARVFDTDIESLLISPEAHADHEVRALYGELDDALADVQANQDRVQRILDSLGPRLEEQPIAALSVLQHLIRQGFIEDRFASERNQPEDSAP